MTTLDERYPDIDEHSDPPTAQVVRDLEMLFTIPASAEIRESVGRALERHGRRPGPARRRMHPAFLRLPTLAAAVVLAVSGALILGQQHRPAPVSAETVLQQAAAPPLPPNRAIHLVYQGTYPGNVERTDIWEETGPRGQITRTANISVTRTHGTLISIARSVDDGRIIRSYNYDPLSGVALQGTITAAQVAKQSAKTPSPFSWLYSSSGPAATEAAVATRIMALKHRSPQGVHLLTPRYFDGALVYPIRTDMKLQRHGQNWPAMTFYFDAHTFILRGIDSPSHQLVGLTVPRTILLKDETLPLSAVPPHIFALRLPKGAIVIPYPR